ncbi:MAG: LemA family protein [Candidatus Magasanikbacteria bacterium]|nr:LemA family protein [Candidatus Magasanikbacteria bacterium]
MPVSNVWRDYNIQRIRRYTSIPKLITVARSYLKNYSSELYALISTLERAQQLQELGLALLGEQFEAEKKLSHEVRSLIVACHHHHALIAKTNFMDLEHDLLDADAHLHALNGLLIGNKKSLHA